MKKVQAAILGSGNIGMDLLYKLRNSKVLSCECVIGRQENSENLKKCREMGYRTSAKSIQEIIEHPACYDVVFDATSAEAHKVHASILKRMKKFVVDLTPAKEGRLCIPCLNGDECVNEDNVNMVTCGGQATVPMAYAVTREIGHADYVEIVATIASSSAGRATRDNIDEYIHTTALALRNFTGVAKTKAMIVLNPADPPIIMRNTLYVVADGIKLERVTYAAERMEQEIQKYVPGYSITVPPSLVKDNTLAMTVQVEGSGDFLPEYAGNLDIITCAAVEMAEKYAYENLLREERCPF
ncbi:acetaldehyde dehydrogenase (acetylating) [Anaerovibrio sp.]|uniref:acetaldehyde dehydrogenase (acetylating) n=1 Tax=Anaerovibrio sp. TaxID=1872532 RepID=UPI0025C36A38|nr:acetaldehyde dehydrogenase (acetylating) [Anaerovibrio sp.]MBR2141989.1 acetaldehyde dehydrogenase (acetylating) [Anaerovibrio sp.]